ncbi:MAG: hypothetical protein JWO04_2364 [Gammaproteobacteria bacterium]|nr:hypothetical protein [Gammaproteobacteria bacterium]
MGHTLTTLVFALLSRAVPSVYAASSHWPVSNCKAGDARADLQDDATKATIAANYASIFVCGPISRLSSSRAWARPFLRRARALPSGRQNLNRSTSSTQVNPVLSQNCQDSDTAVFTARQLLPPQTRETSDQLDQSRIGRRKSTPVEVKSSEVTLEINMQPFASCLPSFRYRDSEHLCCEPSVPPSVGHHSV